MNLLSKHLNHTSKWSKSILIVLLLISIIKPTKAFIPYVYEPNPKELETTGLSIGKTAAQLLDIGQPKEATRLAALAVNLKPSDFRLWSLLGEAQRRSGMLKAASLSLAEATKLNPKNADLLFAEGSLALQQQKPKVAIQFLEKGISIDNKNPISYFQLGNARIMLLEHYLALKAFKNATKLEPKFWEALNNQGLVLFEIGSNKKAIDVWNKVLKIEENAEPMLALGAALNQLEPGNKKSLELAAKALDKEAKYISSDYQKEQLWGVSLQLAAKELLAHPDLRKAVEKAIANSEVKMIPAK